MIILTVIHVLVCFFLIAVVLLQHGRGADMGASFGGSSQTVFGSEGPVSLLNKLTTVAAICFMVTSVSLAYLSNKGGKGSVMRGIKTEQPVQDKSVQVPGAEQVPTPKQEPVTVPMPTTPATPENADNSVPQNLPAEKAEIPREIQEQEQPQNPVVPDPQPGKVNN